nr:hypothetical protein [Tanacetum cinerariifolium]
MCYHPYTEKKVKWWCSTWRLSRGSGDGGVGLLVAWRWYDGVVRQRRCMAMVGGGSYRSGYREHFWGSPEKVFWRGGGGRLVAGG